MLKSSQAHLSEADENYWRHLKVALRIARLLVTAGFACAVHALVPALFTRTASSCLEQVLEIFRNRNGQAGDDRSRRGLPLPTS